MSVYLANRAFFLLSVISFNQISYPKKGLTTVNQIATVPIKLECDYNCHSIHFLITSEVLNAFYTRKLDLNLQMH